MIFFLWKMLGDRRERRAPAVVFAVMTGTALFLWETLTPPWPDSIIYLIPLAYILLFLRGSVLMKAIWLMILILTVGLAAQVTTGIFLFFVNMDALFEPGLLHAAYCVTANLITLGVLVLIVHVFSQEKASLLGKRNLLVFAACYALEAAAEEVLFLYQLYSGESGIYMLGLNLALAGIVTLTIVMQNMLANTIRRKQEVEALNQILKESDRHQKEIEGIYRDVIANQHTLRHQLQIIRDTIDYAGVPEAAKLIGSLDERTRDPLRFATGCTAVDALLTAKYLSAERLGITFEYLLCPLKKIPDITIFCVILSNMLDNAIEAAGRITDTAVRKRIVLEISRSGDMLYLRCVNTMNPAALRYENDSFFSSKGSQNLHGYGIATIREMTERLQGGCTIRPCPEKNLFVVQISLPIDE